MFTTLTTAQSIMNTRNSRLPAGLLDESNVLLVAAEEILLPPLDEGGGEAVDGRMVLAFAVIVKSESGRQKSEAKEEEAKREGIGK
jgi:hypothetical protein